MSLGHRAIYGGETNLVVVGYTENNSAKNSKDSQCDGLGLREVGRVDEGPGLNNDDEGIKVCVRDVE